MKLAFVLLAGAATALASAAHHPEKRVHHGIADHHKVKRNETELVKRDSFSGIATWYDVTTAAGACGDWMSPGDFVVALNSPQLNAYGGYQGGKPTSCYRSITITYNGMSQVATIKDECPTCDWGSLDLSAGLFSSFTSLDQGVFPITWWFNDGDNSGGGDQQQTSQYQPPPDTTTEQAWTPDPTPTTPTSTYVPPPTTTSDVYTPPPTSTSTSSSDQTTTSTSSTPNNIPMMNAAVVQFAGIINAANQ